MMLPTLREQIIAALIDALMPIAAEKEIVLLRAPTQPVAANRCPALLVIPETDSVSGRMNSRVERELTIRFVALAHEKPQQSPYQTADKLLALVHKTIWSHPAIQQRVLAITEHECDWEAEEGDGIAAAVAARYSFHYRTLVHDVTQQG